jgi:hypothetical protein
MSLKLLYAKFLQNFYYPQLPSTALMMEAASTSDSSVNFYQTTRRNIPEVSQSSKLEMIINVDLHVKDQLLMRHLHPSDTGGGGGMGTGYIRTVHNIFIDSSLWFS